MHKRDAAAGNAVARLGAASAPAAAADGNTGTRGAVEEKAARAAGAAATVAGSVRGLFSWFLADDGSDSDGDYHSDDDAPRSPPANQPRQLGQPQMSRWFWAQRQGSGLPARQGSGQTPPQRAVGKGLLNVPSSIQLTAMSSRDSSRQYIWSREHSRRLSRLQAIVRGWIVRRNVSWYPAASVDAIVIDLEHKDRGICSMLWYFLFLALFYMSVADSIQYKHDVELGLSNWVDQVTFGERQSNFYGIASIDDLKLFTKELFLHAYNGNQREHRCVGCSYTEAYLDIGTQGKPVYSADGTTFLGGWDNCYEVCLKNLTQGAVIAQADYGGIGYKYCANCYIYAYCFKELSDTCENFDTATLDVLVRGSNDEDVKIESRDSCISLSTFSSVYGLTPSFSAALAGNILGHLELSPTGEGYIAEKNRVIGGMMMKWNIRKEAPCLDGELADFYGACYSHGSIQQTNITVLSQDGSMSSFAFDSIITWEPGAAAYITVLDVGVYNVGLNFEICGLLDTLYTEAVLPRNLRDFTIVFNLYNGNDGAMFAGVELNAYFHIGGRIELTKTITPFQLPTYEWPSSNLGWDIIKGLFLLLLTWYVVDDVATVLRNLNMAWTLPKKASGTSGFNRKGIIFARSLNAWDLVVLSSDASFVACTAASIIFAAKAYDFVVESEVISGQSVFKTQEHLLHFGQLKTTQLLALVIASILALVRLFYLVRFHRRLSVVTDTIGRGVVHLLHFFFVFFLIVFWYTNIIWVLFGPSDPRYDTWLNTFTAVLRIGLGEFQNYYPTILATDFNSGAIVIFTYQILVVVLMCNVLVAILLDAYGTVVDEMHAAETDTLWESLQTSVCRAWLKFIRFFNCSKSYKKRQLQLARFYSKRRRAGLGDSSGWSLKRSKRSDSGFSSGIDEGENGRGGGVGGGGGGDGSGKGGFGLRRRQREAQQREDDAMATGGFEPALAVAEDTKEEEAGHIELAGGRISCGGIGGPPSPAGPRGRRHWREQPGAAAAAAPAQPPAGAAAAAARPPAGAARGLASLRASSPPRSKTRGRRRRVEFFSMQATAEILRAAPLPEFAVRRKLRQLIYAQMRIRDEFAFSAPAGAAKPGGGATSPRRHVF